MHCFFNVLSPSVLPLLHPLPAPPLTCSTQFHVFEATRPLPRFSLYIPCLRATQPQPQGTVSFTVKERLDRVSGCGLPVLATCAGWLTCDRTHDGHVCQ